MTTFFKITPLTFYYIILYDLYKTEEILIFFNRPDFLSATAELSHFHTGCPVWMSHFRLVNILLLLSRGGGKERTLFKKH